MLIVAGLSLKNLKPRVWDPESPYYLPDLRAVMVSFADFYLNARARQQVTEEGLRAYLGIPEDVQVFLDNGAFYFHSRDTCPEYQAYDDFVTAGVPDWKPIPQDFIPTPAMSEDEQQDCLQRTMDVNRAYRHNGYVPVLHVSTMLDEYIQQLTADEQLNSKSAIAVGGIVPNLLRAPKAMPYEDVLKALRAARAAFAGKQMHIFGIGGTATVHLASVLEIDSVDSSGWRNRAARGIVQLPGCGDRMVANLGKWRGREPSEAEWALLRACECPACQAHGLAGLQTNGTDGFCNRATHNLWVLLEEGKWLDEHLTSGEYPGAYQDRLENSIYLALVEQAVNLRYGQTPGHTEPTTVAA